jgi:hypothetical protein
MNITESFVRPWSVALCAALAGGCIITSNGDDDAGQDATDGDDDSSVSVDDDGPNTLDDGSDGESGDPTVDDTGDDDTTTGPPGDCSENLVLDPGFEAGTPSDVWTEQSATFGTPICDAECTDDANAGPYEGAFWAWFGGLEEPESASLAQTVTIPAAEAAELAFRFSINASTDTGDDTFEVLIDDMVVFMVSDAEMDDYADYTRVAIDVTEFADGAQHTIRFASDHPGHEGTGLITNFFLDSVSVVSCNETAVDSSGSDGGSSTAADDSGTDTGTDSSSDGGSSDSGGSSSSGTTM